jgi:hypothetical protein
MFMIDQQGAMTSSENVSKRVWIILLIGLVFQSCLMLAITPRSYPVVIVLISLQLAAVVSPPVVVAFCETGSPRMYSYNAEAMCLT